MGEASGISCVLETDSFNRTDTSKKEGLRLGFGPGTVLLSMFQITILVHMRYYIDSLIDFICRARAESGQVYLLCLC